MRIGAVLFALPLLFSACVCSEAATLKIPFTPEHWQIVPVQPKEAKPDVQFVRHEGFPQGAVLLRSGTIALKDLSFLNGTIEFDLKPLAEDMPGIQFRRQVTSGNEDAEDFYLRAFADCRASDDCLQYTPVIHGYMLWNAYPQYQTSAFVLDGWNHFKLVISGRRMNVYVNHSTIPTLAVDSLEGAPGPGGLALRGPAVYANLEVTPNATEGLSPQPTTDPSLADRGVVRHWQLGSLTSQNGAATLTYAAMPSPQSGWHPISAERFGLVNLNRVLTYWPEQPRQMLWLRTTVTSDHTQAPRASLGWLGHVWVFVNGSLITEGKNFYYPESERRDPDGRLALQNGSFAVPLRKGANEIVIALDPATHDAPHSTNHYGAGLEMRFDQVDGIVLTRK